MYMEWVNKEETGVLDSGHKLNETKYFRLRGYDEVCLLCECSLSECSLSHPKVSIVLRLMKIESLKKLSAKGTDIATS